jgi:hypothetical protein
MTKSDCGLKNPGLLWFTRKWGSSSHRIEDDCLHKARQSIEYTQMPQMYKTYWWYNILTAFFERWLSGIPPLHYRSFLKEDGPADKIYGNLVPPPNETRSDLIAWQLPTTKILDRQWEIKRSLWKDCLFGLAAFTSACLESWTGLVWSQVTRALVERLTNMIIRLFTEFTCPVVLGGYLCPNRLPSTLNFLYSTSSRSAVIEGSNYGSVLPGKERLKTALASTVLFSSLKWHPTRSSFMQEKHLT